MSYFPCDIPFMSVDELIENNIHTPKDVSSTNVENTGFISIKEALDAVEESRRLNHHKNAKEACAHEYEHRHFLKILMDIQPADVAQVRHGRWLPIVSYNNTYKCSECGRLLVDVTDGLKMVAKHYPYCHCGAKMDEHGEG